MKRCSKCHEFKPLTDFYRAPRTRDGHRGDCIACNLASNAERHRRDPQPARDRVKRWRLENEDRYAKNRAAFAASGGKRLADRKSHLKRKFGLTLEQYNAMLARQRGCCAICRRPPRNIALHVDHDHVTGAIRGLLCFQCNNGLADLQEDPGLLAKAASYLLSHDAEVQAEVALARERAQRLRALTASAAGS